MGITIVMIDGVRWHLNNKRDLLILSIFAQILSFFEEIYLLSRTDVLL